MTSSKERTFNETTDGSFPIPTILQRDSMAACYGKITNPVTDVCWECVFPITVGQNTSLISSSGFTDVTTDADSMCSCVTNGSVTMGMNLGFWEPIRTIEIVREPFCFPSLGGLTMGGRFTARLMVAHPTPKSADIGQAFTKCIGITPLGFICLKCFSIRSA